MRDREESALSEDSILNWTRCRGDHIIPRSQGGKTVDGNLQMLCQKCNNDKSSQ